MDAGLLDPANQAVINQARRDAMLGKAAELRQKAAMVMPRDLPEDFDKTSIPYQSGYLRGMGFGGKKKERKTMSDTMAKDYMNAINAISNVSDAFNTMKEIREGFGETSFGQGATWFQEQFVPGEYRSEEYSKDANLRAAIESFAGAYRKLMSGVAVNPTELERLERFMPSQKDPAELAYGKMALFMNQFKNSTKNFETMLQDRGIEVPESIGQFYDLADSVLSETAQYEPGMAAKDRRSGNVMSVDEFAERSAR